MSKNHHPSQANALANLSSLRGGAMLEEVSAGIADLTQQVKLTKKAGKIIITLTVAPADKNAPEVDRVWVSDEIQVKAPKRPKKDTLMFVDPDKNVLTDKDPQLTFLAGARVLPAEAPEPARSVGKDAAGEARSLAG